MFARALTCSTQLSALALCALLSVPVAGQAAGVREESPTNPSHFGNPHFDCFGVTVLELNDDGSARVRIEEVLRGAPRSGIVTTVFREPGAVPQVGERVLLLGSVSESENTLYHGGDVFRFSNKNREHAIRILAPPERTGPLQLGAFLLVLALPLIGRSLLRRSKSGARWLRYVVRSIAFVAFGVYVFYESGICGYCDIRVDLLLIGPALIWCVVLFFSSFSGRSG